MKRKLGITIAALLLLAFGFATGAWYSAKHSPLRAEMEDYALANILTQVGYAGYLMKGDLAGLRKLIDVHLSGDLSRVARYQGTVADEAFIASKIRTLNAVANLWDVSPPAPMEGSAELRLEWQKMVATNRELLHWARERCNQNPSLKCASPDRAFKSGRAAGQAER